MKEVQFDYNFDLEKVIKDAERPGRHSTTKREEDYVEANYILENFAENNLGEDFPISKRDLKNSTIKTVETVNTSTTKLDGTKIKRKKVVKYFIMTPKEQFKIIRQITESIKIGKTTTTNRTTSYLEHIDLLEEGIVLENGELNREHPLVKKLVPENKKGKKATK